MNGISFGKELKRLRSKTGIPSKELSSKVGKAVTYVSQIERGLIKSPDFQTCYNLLLNLDIQENLIETILEHYGIISAEREQALIEMAQENSEDDWIEQSTRNIKADNDKIHDYFNRIIDKDITRAETLLPNILRSIKDKGSFDFFCSLLKYDFSSITIRHRKELAELFDNYISERYELDDWNELLQRGDSK